MSARYLVTGGAGFVGSHLVRALLARGGAVRVLDNFTTGRRENVLAFASDVELVEGDVRDAETVHEAVAGVECVLHQAALPSVTRSVEHPGTSHDVNATGTLNVLLAARDAGVKRVVYASSSSIYGESEELPKRESMPARPLSPYAASKLAGESYCAAFAQVYGLPAISLRYFNVFGPGQDPTSHYSAVIPRFVTAMARGERPVVFGDGLQSRDFTYVDNVVAANLLAADAPAGVSGIFNVACGERHTLLDLVGALNEILGTDLEAVHEPPRQGEVRHSEAAYDVAAAELGYRPQVEWREGLRRTVGWFAGERALDPLLR